MRIGLIAPPWLPVPPIAYGGTETVVDNLARGLSALGHDVTLFTVGSSSCPVRRASFYDEPSGPMGQTVPEVTHAVAAYEALRHVDVIHDHTVVGPLVAAAEGITSPPRVVTNHGPFTPETRPVFEQIAATTAVVAISHDQARRASKVPIAAVIHHGVDINAYQPGPGDGGYLAFVGRMAPEKGAHRAIKIAREAGLPIRIASKMREPAERAYYEEMVRPLLDSDEAPEELGFQERLTLLQHAVALVNPIRWAEPFGLVMAESLATATPVVAFREGAAPEIVSDGSTGFLCADTRQAVAAVSCVPILDRHACRAAAASHFSIERMARDHVRLYEALLEGRRPLLGARMTRLRAESAHDSVAAGLGASR